MKYFLIFGTILSLLIVAVPLPSHAAFKCTCECVKRDASIESLPDIEAASEADAPRACQAACLDRVELADLDRVTVDSCAEIAPSPADVNAPPSPTGIPALENPLGTTSVPQLLGRVINAFLGITGSLALLLFIYGGFLWLTSGGNEDSIKKGKATIVWAVLGLVIIFGAYALVNFVISRALGLV